MPYLPRRKPRPAHQGRKYKDDRYNGRQWRNARMTYLKQNPLCCICNRAAAVVDHVCPVRMDPSLFYEPQNWQPMCHPCHNRKSATIDKQIKEPPPDLMTYKARVQQQLLEWLQGEGG